MISRGPPREGARLHRPRQRGGRDAAVRRPRAARAAGVAARRQLRPADGLRRRRQPDADRAGGDLRPGRVPDRLRRRGRRDRPGERHRLWPVELRLDPRHRPRPPRRRRGRGGDVLRQQPERSRPAPAVRRHQGVGHRPRRRQLELRGVLRAEERVRVASPTTTFRSGVRRERRTPLRNPHRMGPLPTLPRGEGARRAIR